MRPALSILFFTTLSGAGYGLWCVLGLALAAGLPTRAQHETWFVALAAGLALSTTGLLFSVAHLGQPQRAWRALSQWRSSWLSREGVAALSCAVIALGVATAIVFDADRMAVRALGLTLSACAALTVFCTARIYTSLPTIAAWHNRFVLPVYLTLALETGALWAGVIVAALRGSAAVPAPALLAVIAIIVSAALCKCAYWKHIDHAPTHASTGSATGLEQFGSVRTFEHPHTEANYLTHEMGFVLARKHAGRLRVIASVALFGLPLLMLVASAIAGGLALAGLAAALLSAMLGAFIERWLFFAQARHVVALYYGARQP